jgi:Tol biopolymer transport system component
MGNLPVKKILYTLTGGLMLLSVILATHRASYSALPVWAFVAPQQAETHFTFVWVDRSGNVQPLGAPPRAYTLPDLSPDGQRIAMGIGDNVWVYDIPTGSLTNLTPDGDSHYPTWTHDGKRIAYASTENGSMNVFWKAADGSGAGERLTASEYNRGAQAFSPDGLLLSFYEIHPTTTRDVWMLPLTGNQTPWPFIRTPKKAGGVMFSADSKWLAYVAEDTGRYEIHIRPIAGSGRPVQVSFNGGTEPIWPRKSGELFYRQDDQRMAVEITTQPTLVVGTPRVLFEGKYEKGLGMHANWDATADGQRFLMLKAVE